MVGPDKCRDADAQLVAQLASCPNEYMLGSKEVHQLPDYMQHVDVGLLCYRDNDNTKCIYPLTLHEFLAAGKPVVVAPIRTL